MKYEGYEMSIILYNEKSDVVVATSSTYGGGGESNPWSIKPDRSDS